MPLRPSALQTCEEGQSGRPLNVSACRRDPPRLLADEELRRSVRFTPNSGHSQTKDQCLLSVAKRTSRGHVLMSAYDPERTFGCAVVWRMGPSR